MSPCSQRSFPFVSNLWSLYREEAFKCGGRGRIPSISALTTIRSKQSEMRRHTLADSSSRYNDSPREHNGRRGRSRLMEDDDTSRALQKSIKHHTERTTLPAELERWFEPGLEQYRLEPGAVLSSHRIALPRAFDFCASNFQTTEREMGLMESIRYSYSCLCNFNTPSRSLFGVMCVINFIII